MVNEENPYLWVRQASYMPILVLGGEEGTAEMLELGADAYMTKPLDLNELVARVKSLLRRKPKDSWPGGNPKEVIKDCLNKGGSDLDGLTPIEFRLASCLVLNKGRLLGYSRIIREVWGGREVSRKTLQFYIRCLRRKLANINIFGMRGIGYCFSGR